jgi:hypothetical protein
MIVPKEVHKMIKSAVKSVLRGIAPDLLDIIRGYLKRIEDKKTFLDRQNFSARKFYGSHPITILSGPFKGMKYINETVWGPIEPKWFGTYESEIHAAVQKILKKQYDTVIDVGSAEGYYSVGLAWKMPKSEVLSYEVDPWSRLQQRRLAAMNNVSNLRVFGRCTHKEIDKRSRKKTLIICDIEGFEMELLNPEMASSLRYSDCLVELHHFQEISMTKMEEIFNERFSGSHVIERYPMILRDCSMIPEFLDLALQVDVELLDERRGMKQVWLWMSSRGDERSTVV